MGSSRADRAAAADRVVNGGPTETALQAVERIASARGADRLESSSPRASSGCGSAFRLGYGGAGGLAYAAARRRDASVRRATPSTANDRTAGASAAVIAGIAAAAAGAGSAASPRRSRSFAGSGRRARGRRRGPTRPRVTGAVAVDAARDAEDEASRRRKEAGTRCAPRASDDANGKRRSGNMAAAERRRPCAGRRRREGRPESRAELAAAKAEIGNQRRRPSGRVAGGYDASRYETDRTPPPPPSIPPPFPLRKTALPPSPLQGLAAATGADPDAAAPRRAPSSRKPTAANPGTVAPARPASAMPVERSGSRRSCP